MEEVKNPLVNMMETIQSSDGAKMDQKIGMLNLTYTIFSTNFNQLNGSLERYKQDLSFVLELMATENIENFQEYLSEVTRLLHNFLASVSTLVDHTRVFCNEVYEGKEFYREYQGELEKQFKSVDLVKFVQDLRNFALHQRLPVASANLSFSNTSGTSHSISLKVKELKEWSGWKAPSKRYLESIGDVLDLQEVMKEYASIADSFYSWFNRRQYEIHQQAFRELNDLKKEYRLLYEKGNDSFSNE